MSKDIIPPPGMNPRLRCAIDFVSAANNAEELDDKITAALKAIEELEIFINCVKVCQQRFKSEVEQPFANDIRYIYPENGAKELVVVTTNLEKPWVAVDEALEKLGISRMGIIKTEYSYLQDEKEGRFIECRMLMA